MLCVAPANGGNIEEDEVEAFIIPKGTIVKLNDGECTYNVAENFIKHNLWTEFGNLPDSVLLI